MKSFYVNKVFYLFLFLFFHSFVVIYSQNVYECGSFCRNKLSKKSERILPNKLYIQTKNFKNYRKKHRLRIVSGNYEAENINISNNSLYFIYSGWGLGVNNFKYALISSGNDYSIKNNSLEVSYTFGDKITFTLSTNIISSGEAVIKNSDGEFLSSNVSANSYSGIFGIDFVFFEILLGIREESIVYKNFYNKNSLDTLDSDFQINGKQFQIGIGRSF